MSRRLSLTTFCSLALVAFAASAVAQPQQARVLRPAPRVVPQPDYDLPRFGFESFNLHGVGERVTHVSRRGLAAEMGLERGDVVLRMNGHRLDYHGSWNDALREAMFNHGGWVRLSIRDVRTGRTVNREIYLGTNPGPITPKSHGGGFDGHDHHSHGQRHSGHQHDSHYRGPRTQNSFGPSNQLKSAAVQLGAHQLQKLIND